MMMKQEALNPFTKSAREAQVLELVHQIKIICAKAGEIIDDTERTNVPV
jgi:hypothetical protein